MVGIQGIAGVPEPVGGARVRGRSNAPAPSIGPSTDGIEISPQAAQASAAVPRATEGQNEIREERVAESRQRIEDGAYKLQEVVLHVAARLSRFVE